MTKKTLPCGKKQDFSEAHESNWKQKLNEHLKKQGLRATRPREKVAEIALKQPSHFEIQELILAVQKEDPSISPATVYRSVITLCEAKILHETLQSRSGVTLYEAVHHDHHDHIVCLDCGAIFEFHDEAIEKKQAQTLKKMGFEDARHQHVIYARCLEMKKLEPKKK